MKAETGETHKQKKNLRLAKTGLIVRSNLYSTAVHGGASTDTATAET